MDERGEIFPVVSGKPCFEPGMNTDILTGCGKAEGVEMAVRVMSPTCVAVDEITASKDVEALLHAGWCGVRVIATAHGASLDDLRKRPAYEKLLAKGLFDWVAVMDSKKFYHLERMA